MQRYFKESVLVFLKMNSTENIEDNMDRDLDSIPEQKKLNGISRLQNFVRTKIIKKHGHNLPVNRR